MAIEAPMTTTERAEGDRGQGPHGWTIGEPTVARNAPAASFIPGAPGVATLILSIVFAFSNVGVIIPPNWLPSSRH